MSNKQGFVTLEALYYLIISLILTIILTSLILRNVSYQNNEKIKVYQSLDLIRQSLLKYPKISNFKKDELEFVDHVRLRIKNNEIYETPGYMPYLQGVTKATFKHYNYYVILSFIYKKQHYEQVIFYVK